MKGREFYRKLMAIDVDAQCIVILINYKLNFEHDHFESRNWRIFCSSFHTPISWIYVIVHRILSYDMCRIWSNMNVACSYRFMTSAHEILMFVIDIVYRLLFIMNGCCFVGFLWWKSDAEWRIQSLNTCRSILPWTGDHKSHMQM